jgi:hypothetical protein
MGLASDCEADKKKFCGKVKPGEGRTHACMESHVSELSEGCRRAEFSNYKRQVVAQAAIPKAKLLSSSDTPGHSRSRRVLIRMWGMWDHTPYPFAEKTRTMRQRFDYGTEVYGRHEVEVLVGRYTAEYNRDMSKAYHSIHRRVAQADIGRYLLVFYYGGLYLDNDVELAGTKTGTEAGEYIGPTAGTNTAHGRLVLTNAEWENDNGVWFVEKLLEEEELTGLGPREKKIRLRIANYALGCHKPKCMALRVILDEAVRRVLELSDHDWDDQDVLYCTGPDVVTTMYDQHEPQLFSTALDSSAVVHSATGTWRDKQDAA